MEPLTLAAVTSAVVTLALDAAKQAAPQVAKDTWGRIKGWLGWTNEPPTEDLAGKVASALQANTQAAERIVAELKKSDAGTASRLASKISIVVTNTTGDIRAAGKVVIVQATDVKSQGDMVIGGG